MTVQPILVRSILWWLTVPGSFALLPGCVGTETGNPRKEPATLGLGIHSSSPDVVLGSGAGGDRVESAWLRFSGIARSSCTAIGNVPDDSTSQAIAGAFVVNLLDPNAQFPDLTLAGNPLCGIDLTLAPEATNSAAQAGPGSTSILITGTRQDGAPFAISTRATLPFTLVAPAPIDPATYDSVLLGFDVAVWLTGTNLETIPLDAQGVARLDGATQPGSTATFESQIPPGTKLYPDLNGDGVLDAEELAQPIAEQ